MKNTKCWAARIGNCSNKISREHIFTEKIFLPDTFLKISHGPNSKVYRTHKRNNLVSKILCTKHNSELSPLDSEAIKLFNASRSIYDLLTTDSLSRKSSTHIINTHIFERWALKTLANVVASKMIEPASEKPIDHFSLLGEKQLNRIFGKEYFTQHAGLYYLENHNRNEPWGDYYAVNTIVSEINNTKIGGAYIKFNAFWFLLWLNENQSIDEYNGSEIFGSSQPRKLPGDIVIRDNEYDYIHRVKFV